MDILELSGATSVLPLKHQLGDYLANRVDAGRPEAHVVGEFRGLQIAELPAHDTPFVGKTVRDTQLRQQTGLSVVGLLGARQTAPGLPADRDPTDSVLVVAGTAHADRRAQRAAAPAATDAAAGAGDRRRQGRPGGGQGAQAQRAARARDRSDARPRSRRSPATSTPSSRATRPTGGCSNAPASSRRASVLLTTNDDAMNIYLAVYCRRLNPDLRIVSRITHERNLEAIHRAGADFVLSYTTLGIEAVMSLLRGYPPVLLGKASSCSRCRSRRRWPGGRCAIPASARAPA